MKPKVFVSSTILDFEDLRSALKYYLEELGYEVQMSEYPNFKIDTDKSISDICLHNLESCQYFILLIGYRRGGWYEENKISITNAEYLAAKKLIESGHPIRMIILVRKSLLSLKKDREEMIRNIQEKSQEYSEIIKNTGTTIIDDPNYIFSFISEVSKGIIIPGYSSPVNNWLFGFETFKDIITALRYTFDMSDDLETKRIKKLLIDELKFNSERFLIWKKKTNKSENYLNYFFDSFNDRVHDSDGKLAIGERDLIIQGSEVGYLFLNTVILPIQNSLSGLKTQVIEKVILEGRFLDYKIENHNYDTSPLTFTLEKLYRLIDAFKKLLISNVYKDFSDEISKLARDGSAYLPEIKLSITAFGIISTLMGYTKINILIDSLLKVFESNDYTGLYEYYKKEYESLNKSK